MWRFVAVALVGCAGASQLTEPSAPAHRHTAVIDHTWPKPTRLPVLPPHLRSTLERPVVVIPQLGPEHVVAASKAERERLAKLVTKAKGITRIAALDRLAGALDDDREDAMAMRDDTQASAAPVIAAYLAVIAEPGFATYTKADEVLFRAARLLFEDGRANEAEDLATQLLTEHPSSRLVADVHVLVADNLPGDLPQARMHYEEAMATGRSAIESYARLRHAGVLTSLGEYAGALSDCERVAAASELLRQPAAQQCVYAFAEGGALANAREYFTRLDPESVAGSLRRLALAYQNLGKVEDAIATLEEMLAHVTAPEEVCALRALLFDAREVVGARVPILVDAKLLAEAARTAPVCRVDVDERLGELAWEWQMELPKSEADPRQVDELWQDELEVVTENRRAIALLDHAYLVWELARGERRPAAWDRAAAALQAAYDADHSSVEQGAIAAARANAAALRTSP